MVSIEVLICAILAIWITLIFRKYSPSIDIVRSGSRYVILLWYNGSHYSKEPKRLYIKLFEV